MERTLPQRFLRAALFLAVLAAAFVVPLAPFVLTGVAGAYLAYDGARTRTAVAVVAALAAAELVTGAPLGVLSLSAAVAALVLRLTVRFVAWVPWVRREGWSPAAFTAAVLAGWAAAALMTVTGVALAAGVYGAGLFSVRLHLMFAASWWALPAVVAATLLCLRRIDVPFRKPIRFSSQ